MSDWTGIIEQASDASRLDSERDGEPAPTHEEVLAQIIYEAIADFIERDEFRLIADLHNESFDLDEAIQGWVDQQRPKSA